MALEWMYPLRGWKVETDLWHHPRKYLVPAVMMLMAGVTGLWPVAVWIWMAVNRILPFYWGPLQVFIKNNIRVDRYAGNTTCPVTVIGSDADTTLSAELQKKLAGCYADAEIKIFSGIRHEDYLTSSEVIQYVKHSMGNDMHIVVRGFRAVIWPCCLIWRAL